MRRLDLGRTLPRFMALSATVALATTAIAAPIIVLYYGGEAGRGADSYVLELANLGPDLWAAVAGVNLPISLIDKILTGVIAFSVVRVLTRTRAPQSFAPPTY